MSTARELLNVEPLSGAGPLGTVDQLLRDRPGFLERIATERDLASTARALILTIAVSAAIFGATIGAYRGGTQILFAALKLPLVVLLTAGITCPVLTGLSRVLARDAERSSLQQDLALILSALALGAIVIASLSPLVLLVMSSGAGYHTVILVVVACCAAGGLASAGLFVRGLLRRSGKGHLVSGALVLVLFAIVGAQLTWTLRPYLVRPRATEVPFVRALEGGFFDAVHRSSASSRGVFFRDEAPLPEEQR